ncbi:MAG TPA: alpha/beta hydrolase [Acetobacteraceae bacterium]|nr:alpha/beta hydrolase [Acetobacteraceae bacterium]
MSSASAAPAGRFIRVGRARVHFVQRGEGRPVLLLHGNGATWRDFEVSGLMDALAATYRVTAFDRPGFGHSSRPFWRRWTAAAQAELLMQAARRLGIERPLVLGHSWGALVALHAAIAWPGEVAGAVLVSGYYMPTRRADVALLSIPGLPVIGRLISYTVLPRLARQYAPEAVRRIFAPDPVPERFRQAFRGEVALRPSQLHASSQDNWVLNASAAAAQRGLGRIAAPVAIIAGSADAIVPTERQSVPLHRRLPGSRLRLLQGHGHMVHYFAVEEIAQEVAAVEELACRTI